MRDLDKLRSSIGGLIASCGAWTTAPFQLCCPARSAPSSLWQSGRREVSPPASTTSMPTAGWLSSLLAGRRSRPFSRAPAGAPRALRRTIGQRVSLGMRGDQAGPRDLVGGAQLVRGAVVVSIGDVRATLLIERFHDEVEQVAVRARRQAEDPQVADVANVDRRRGD